MTAGVALLLGVAGLYALSGAGRIRSLPLSKPALVVVGGVFTLRGLLLFPELAALLAGRPVRPPRGGYSSSRLVWWDRRHRDQPESARRARADGWASGTAHAVA